MAPRVGLEPTAYRLTAGCSTIELPWNIGGDIQIRTRFELSVSRATIWRFNQLSYIHHKMVEVKGLEPPAPWSQTTCATKLRYTSELLIYF